MGLNFKEFYEESLNSYPSITNLPNSEVENIQKQYGENKLTEKTNVYLMAAFTATLFFSLLPFVFSNLYFYVSNVTNSIFKFKGTYSKEFIEILNYSFGIPAIAIIFYLFVLPHLGKLFRSKSNPFPFDKINPKQGSYILGSLIAVYIAVGLITLVAYFNYEGFATFFSKYYKYYLLIPLCIIVSLLLLFSLTFLFMLPFRRIAFRKRKSMVYKRIDICVNIFKVLKKVMPLDNYYFLSNNDSNFILNCLKKISLQIRNYPSNNVSSFEIEEISNDFIRASKEFESNITTFVSTKDTHSENIKASLIFYLNIFLAGDLTRLPKSETTNVESNQKKAKFIHYFLLAVYLTAPILIVLILKHVFSVSFDEYTQSLIKILYIIWAFIGVFSNPFVINSDSKELIREMLKTLAGKG